MDPSLLPAGDTEKALSSEPDISPVTASPDRDVHRVNDSSILQDQPIENGMDVSRFIVSLQDDVEEQALTFRSVVLGTVLAGFGAALTQIYTFKPVSVPVSSVFLLLATYFSGLLWDKCLPKKSSVEGTRLDFLGPALNFITPPKFKLKEHVVASLIATTASAGSPAIMIFAVQRLYFSTTIDATTAVLSTFSAACFGYGLVGLLRPVTVYPSEMVYWAVSLRRSLLSSKSLHCTDHRAFRPLMFSKHCTSTPTKENAKRVQLFWVVFTAVFTYEIIPAYIFPLLNGVNIFCLASQKASPRIKDIFTNLFGGTDSNEGLGLLSLSVDWQFIGSWYLSVPLIQQGNAWVGYVVCYIAIMAIFYSNTWNSLSFPMLSTSIFAANGSVYNQAAVFGSKFQLNQTALAEIGLPALTGSNAWSNLMTNLAIGALIAHTTLFWGPEIRQSFVNRKANSDPHYAAMQAEKYKEAPWWWYMVLLLFSFFAGLIVVLKGRTTLPWYSYLIAIMLGMAVTPFSNILWGRTGSSVTTTQIMKMVAGIIDPGKPVANLYFSMWSHNIVVTAISLAGDLKIGQYLKIPPRVMFLTQVYGSIIGAIVNYVVMDVVVNSQRSILLNPKGTNVWSGHAVQSLNSAAVTWSLAKQLYGPKGPYFVIPLGLFIGMVAPLIQWFIFKWRPMIGGFRVDSILFPVIFFYSTWLTSGVTSATTSTVLVGIASQVWLRKRNPAWFNKYNYILGGALDGGSQVMIFILSFAVFGASGTSHRFPSWAGNPRIGNVDHCNGNGAIKT